MHIQPLMSYSSIESLDISILCWLAWLNVHQRNLVAYSSSLPASEKCTLGHSTNTIAMTSPRGQIRFARPNLTKEPFIATSISTTSEYVLIAIDIAKLKHDVFVKIASGKTKTLKIAFEPTAPNSWCAPGTDSAPQCHFRSA